MAEAFKQITGNLTEYTCRSVVLTDTLSDYAELENAEHLNPTVKATASDGSEVDLSGVDIQTTYNEETRTVTATFQITERCDLRCQLQCQTYSKGI